MKKLLAAVTLLAFIASSAFAATSGILTQSLASGGGGGTPGGSSGQIQYNNGGSFGGLSAVPVTQGGQGVATPSMAFVGDSITNYGGIPATTSWIAITSTTAGGTSFIVSSALYTGYIGTGDTIYLCSTNAAQSCSGTGEQVTVGSYSGPPTTTIPITGTLANSGEVYMQVSSARLPYYGINAWQFWANAINGWPMNYVGTFGLPGATVSQITGNSSYTNYLGQTTTQDQVALAVATGAKYIHILMGTNDVSTGASGADTDFALLQTSIAEVIAAGATPIVGTIPSNGNVTITAGQCGTPSAAQGAYMTRYNYKIRQLALSGNIIVVDYNKATTRPDTGLWAAAGTAGSGSLTGWWGVPAGVSYTPDCTHPNYVAGTMAMARMLADTLSGAQIVRSYASSNGFSIGVPSVLSAIASNNAAVDFSLMYSSTFGTNNAGNMLPNGGMSNATGGGATADGWASNNGRTPSQGANVFSVIKGSVADGNAYDRNYWQRITIPAGADWGQAYTSAQDVVSAASQTLSASNWQPGDTIIASARVRMTCFSQTYQSTPTIAINFYNGATQIGRTYAPAWRGATGVIQPPSVANTPDLGYDPAACLANTVLKSAPVVVPLGTTKIIVWLMVNGEGVSVDFTNVELRKAI